jgi:DNA-binding MarR family transcriptional regulator
MSQEMVAPDERPDTADIESRRPIGSEDPLEWVRFFWERDQDAINPDRFLVMISIMRLHQLSMKDMKEALRAVKLNPRLYLFLMTLVLSEHGARLLSRLSDDLMVHPTTVTVLADQLEKRKLVKRTPHPTDRRAVFCTLTPAGRAAALRATEIMNASGFGLADLDDPQASKLLRELTKVRRIVGDREERRERHPE